MSDKKGKIIRGNEVEKKIKGKYDKVEENKRKKRKSRRNYHRKEENVEKQENKNKGKSEDNRK